MHESEAHEAVEFVFGLGARGPAGEELGRARPIKSAHRRRPLFLVRQMTDAHNHRLRLVQFARQHGIKPSLDQELVKNIDSQADDSILTPYPHGFTKECARA